MYHQNQYYSNNNAMRQNNIFQNRNHNKFGKTLSTATTAACTAAPTAVHSRRTSLMSDYNGNTDNHTNNRLSEEFDNHDNHVPVENYYINNVQKMMTNTRSSMANKTPPQSESCTNDRTVENDMNPNSNSVTIIKEICINLLNFQPETQRQLQELAQQQAQNNNVNLNQQQNISFQNEIQNQNQNMGNTYAYNSGHNNIHIENTNVAYNYGNQANLDYQNHQQSCQTTLAQNQGYHSNNNYSQNHNLRGKNNTTVSRRNGNQFHNTSTPRLSVVSSNNTAYSSPRPSVFMSNTQTAFNNSNFKGVAAKQNGNQNLSKNLCHTNTNSITENEFNIPLHIYQDPIRSLPQQPKMQFSVNENGLTTTTLSTNSELTYLQRYFHTLLDTNQSRLIDGCYTPLLPVLCFVQPSESPILRLLLDSDSANIKHNLSLHHLEKRSANTQHSSVSNSINPNDLNEPVKNEQTNEVLDDFGGGLHYMISRLRDMIDECCGKESSQYYKEYDDLNYGGGAVGPDFGDDGSENPGSNEFVNNNSTSKNLNFSKSNQCHTSNNMNIAKPHLTIDQIQKNHKLKLAACFRNYYKHLTGDCAPCYRVHKDDHPGFHNSKFLCPRDRCHFCSFHRRKTHFRYNRRVNSKILLNNSDNPTTSIGTVDSGSYDGAADHQALCCTPAIENNHIHNDIDQKQKIIAALGACCRPVIIDKDQCAFTDLKMLGDEGSQFLTGIFGWSFLEENL